MLTNRISLALICVSMLLGVQSVSAQEAERRIEEVVVTAERRESTVSDTSLSITAFGQEMIEDFGIQGADELVNFTPSTTRDEYDIRIRGVGRNFRALGGDPGVATYYNGVYSEDFGIAASEAALYDVARVEVLRGPQGTLYGRNAIGGALNYITNQPSYETEAEVRFMGGNLGTQEWYGMLSGPLIEDKLAYRFTAVRRDRDGAQDGLLGTEDVNSIGDQNLALAINWQMTDTMEFNIRYNDRDSDRKIGQEVLVNESSGSLRGNRSVGRADIPTWQYALGISPVPDPVFSPIAGGFVPYTGPTVSYENDTVQGIYARPGVDESLNSKPNAAYQTPADVLQDDIEDLGGDALTNSAQDETFNQNAVQANWSWDINDRMQLKWIGGWSDFDYTFFDDFDRSTSGLTVYNQNVKQSLENYSHEIQLLWDIGDNLELTTGAYYFNQNLRQQYDTRDIAAQGRFTRPTQYGLLAPLAGALGPAVGLGSAPQGQQVTGVWGGDPFGRVYAIDNKVETEAWALFSQGTYTFNEEWALTVGVRYANDDKEATENRGGRTDIDADEVNFLITDFTQPGTDPTNPNTWAFNQFCNGTYGADCATIGLTDLAVMNMFTGAASFAPTFDPQMPITPTCELTDQDCTNPLNLDGLPISFADNSNDSDSWSDFNFRVNVDWSPNDNTLIYASVTTGYRAGGYSLGLLGTTSATDGGETNPPRSYDEETVVAYEIGYKGSLLDDTLQLFSSFYYYDYEGYQDEVSEDNVAGSTDSVVINAGDAINYGWEIEGTWLPTNNWTLGGNYSWTQTEYQDDVIVLVNDDPNRPQPLFPIARVNLEGNDLKRIPEHKFTIWSGYDFTLPTGVLNFNGVYSYTGDFYDTGVKRDLDRVRGRGRLDVSATWRDNMDRWQIRAFIDNVTDEGAARGLGTSTGFQDYQLTADYLYPRFYGVDVIYRFGHLL